MGRAARQPIPTGTSGRGQALDGQARRVPAALQGAWDCRCSTTATTFARSRSDAGVARAFDIPGFVPEYIRPLFCRGIGPFRWAALSGDPEDIYKTDAKVKELIPDDPHLHHWLDMARSRIQFQGLPARICWVGLGQRHRLGLAFNEMVASGELSAPVVIGRDHLDSGSVASPNRETEAMRDGSDAVSDWPLLNALLNTASGATWVSIHHGGGVGMGYSQHAGVVIVCDGSRGRRPARRGACCGTIRAPASCATPMPAIEIAIDCAREQGLDLPMIELTPRDARDRPPCRAQMRAGSSTLPMLRRIYAQPAALRSRRGGPRPHRGRRLRWSDKIVAAGDAAYGINTGFGLLAQTRIPTEQLELLQRNLLLSHAAGVGEPLPDAVVRLILALKVNALARGYSGISLRADRGAAGAAAPRGLSR